MLDYTTLVDQVRRLMKDDVTSYIDTKDSTTKDSYYVALSNDGYATIRPSGAIINGIPMPDSSYSVDRNLVKFDTLIPAESEVVIHYDLVTYQDSDLINFIGDTIHNLVEPILNRDFEFGVDTASSTITNQDVSNNYRALFVMGSVLQLMGVQISEASGDAIYIKDGDTIIDTASSSREAIRGYAPFIERWNTLLDAVRVNMFQGVTQY